MREMQVVKEVEILEKRFNIYGDVDNLLFLAKDIAEWIDYSKTSNGYYNVAIMLNSIDDDEKVKIVSANNVNTGEAAMIPEVKWYVTEDGLYEILMQSRKPIAKQFKKKVKEILKDIRKFGVYTYQLPQTYIEALEAIIAIEKKKQIAELERDKAIATKAEIGTRREATAMNTASQLSKENTKLKSEIGFTKTYATIKKVEIATQAKYRWKPLKDYSNDHEYEIKKVNDVNYGTVNCYHADVWYAVYEIDLVQLIEG